MDAFLTLKKPSDVNFSKGVPEDKPIGDEMSRLIAQELAARERELVQLKPEDIKKAQQWIGVTNDESLPPKKSVSFSNMTNVVEEEHEIESFDMEEKFEFEETDSIFSKFKKTKAPPPQPDPEPEPEPIAAVITLTMQQVYEKLLELERRMDANHAEIMRLVTDGRV
jgi:hypothetical protein